MCESFRNMNLISTSSNRPLDLYKKTFLKVYNLKILNDVPENYKDTSAVLTLENYAPDPGVGLNVNGFYSSFDYDEYVTDGNGLMLAEIKHYNNEYIQSGKVGNLLKYLKNEPFSRRGVIDFWENYQFDNKKPYPCIIYSWFRRHGQTLHLNCHMRADDAYKILLMDLHIMTSLHSYVAGMLDLKLGTYHHFVDSLHFYRRNEKEIDSLYGKLKSKKLVDMRKE